MCTKAFACSIAVTGGHAGATLADAGVGASKLELLHLVLCWSTARCAQKVPIHGWGAPVSSCVRKPYLVLGFPGGCEAAGSRRAGVLTDSGGGSAGGRPPASKRGRSIALEQTVSPTCIS